MWTLRSMSLALFAVAVAQTENWEGYARKAHQYAGDFYPGPTNGDFGDFLQHGQSYSHYPAQYASQYSKDQIAEAKGYEKEHAPHVPAADPVAAAAPLAMAAEAPQATKAPQAAKAAKVETAAKNKHQKQNVTEADEALAKRDESAKDAEQSIQALGEWGAKLKSDLEDKNFSRDVAEGIVSKVQVHQLVHRERLQRHFDEALRALEPAEGAAGNSTSLESVARAEHEARKCADELEELDHKERKAMRSTLHSINKEGRHKTKNLWKSARKAAHQAYHQGMHAARAQRKAGAHEHVYERTMREAEKVSEGLLGRAESRAEHAEDLMEQQSESVDHELGKLLHHLQDEAHHARKERLHHAVERAHKARRAIREAARARKEATRHAEPEEHEQVSAKKEAGNAHEAEESKPRKEKGNKTKPTNFLAQNMLQSSSLTPVVLCAAGMCFATVFLVLRFRRDEAALAPPLLG